MKRESVFSFLICFMQYHKLFLVCNRRLAFQSKFLGLTAPEFFIAVVEVSELDLFDFMAAVLVELLV